MNTLQQQTAIPCAACAAGLQGPEGHAAMRFYVGGPYPGQSIHKCGGCGDRWIRHYGGAPNVFAWTRYAEQFPSAIRRPMTTVSRNAVLPF